MCVSWTYFLVIMCESGGRGGGRAKSQTRTRTRRKGTLLGKGRGGKKGGGCYSKSPWLCKVAADVVVRTMEKCVGISDCGQIFLEGAKGFQGDSHQIGEYFSKL